VFTWREVPQDARYSCWATEDDGTDVGRMQRLVWPRSIDSSNCSLRPRNSSPLVSIDSCQFARSSRALHAPTVGLSYRQNGMYNFLLFIVLLNCHKISNSYMCSVNRSKHDKCRPRGFHACLNLPCYQRKNRTIIYNCLQSEKTDNLARIARRAFCCAVAVNLRLIKISPASS